MSTPEHTATMTRERDDRGQYVETVGPEDVLDVFDAVDGPAITSSDVAEYLECTTEAARQKLQRLVEDGTLDRRKTGRTVIYWRAERPTHTPADTPPRTPAEESIGDDVDADTDPLTAALDALDATDDRRAAVRACVEYLREHGTAQKSGFVENVYADHDAGYGSAGGWWNKIGKEYLKAVADEYGPVEPPAKEGSHTWRWVE